VQQDPARYVRPARTAGVAAAIPEGWTTYTDPMGFTVGYPKSLVLLPETEALPDRRPPLVHRVRFLDRELAAGDTAALEPPQFSVEVFAAPPGPLRSWLEENGRIPKGAGVEVLEVPGAREALRIRDPRMLAPNEFSWYATDRYTFLVVALGSEGEAMRKTFRLIGREKGAVR
jgi:hypothetical protein